MKLTLLVMHVLSCWLTFVAHALAAGRQPGTRSPWESPPLSPTSWDHNTKDHRHVVAGHTGTKDSLVSTQEPLSPGTRSFIEETGMRHNAPNVETLVQWNEQFKWPAQHYDPYSHLLPLSEDEDAQHTTSYQPSRVQHSDPESQHYWSGHPPSFYDPWPGHRSDQHTSNARWHYTDDDMKIPPVSQQFPPESSSSSHSANQLADRKRNEIRKRGKRLEELGYAEAGKCLIFVDDDTKAHWQTFNDLFRHSFRGVLNKAIQLKVSISEVVESRLIRGRLEIDPASWIPSAVDNPFGPLEKREPIASIKEEYRLVSEWANKERDKLAANRKTSDINYMRRDESSEKWVMKEGLMTGNIIVTNRPIVLPQRGEKDPVLHHVERAEHHKRNKKVVARMKRQWQAGFS